MDVKESIILYCKENRLSSTEVADALGKTGVIPKLQALSSNVYKVGNVFPVFTANNSNYAVHEQIRNVKKGDVVIIFAEKCEGRAIIGDLVTKFLLLYKGAEAVVVCGLVRDAASIKRQAYSVWSEGVTPLGCFNTPSEPFSHEAELELRKIYEGGIAVCDEGGVTVIPSSKINTDTLAQLEAMEIQEDIWFFCLDTLKWDTKKIVCDKAYLENQDLLSSVHIERLKNIQN